VRIGLTFNVRRAERPSDVSSTYGILPLPGDDLEEEFDSPETIAAIAAALESLGHEVELLGYGEPLLQRLLVGPRPDLVWNFAEGHGEGRSREARVPAVLEMLDIPYTGSDPLTLAATLDKDCAKRLVASAGVATPRWYLYDGDAESIATHAADLSFPVFVKPAYEGSSKGILNSSILYDVDELRPALEQLHEAYCQPVLVEEFIDGDELTVGFVGNGTPDVLGIMRVIPRAKRAQPFVYSLEVKRNWQQQVRYECPARLQPAETEAVNQAALAAWKALGCRDVARFDFRLRGGVPYFLETNPLPGLSPTSGDLVLLARQVGISHRDLISRILTATIRRLASRPAISKARLRMSVS
jgi:D-alanine-D-alanine ligase